PRGHILPRSRSTAARRQWPRPRPCRPSPTASGWGSSSKSVPSMALRLGSVCSFLVTESFHSLTDGTRACVVRGRGAAHRVEDPGDGDIENECRLYIRL